MSCHYRPTRDDSHMMRKVGPMWDEMVIKWMDGK